MVDRTNQENSFSLALALSLSFQKLNNLKTLTTFIQNVTIFFEYYHKENKNTHSARISLYPTKEAQTFQCVFSVNHGTLIRWYCKTPCAQMYPPF